MSNKSFISLIEDIDKADREQRDRGTLFEILSITYLKNEPMYHKLFEEVWMLKDVPEKYNIPKVDNGVDLVAKRNGSDELTAIQCKYYSSETTISKSHIDSFLNEVGKNYYTDGLLITTTDKWSKNADEALEDRNKNIMRLSLSDLQNSNVDWSTFSFNEPERVKLDKKKSPRNHQVPAINAVIEGFKEVDRGKLIMAPGTGKTYTSMVIAEQMAKKSKDTFKVLYLVPSIQLLSQTLRSWNADMNLDMESIAVCSDRKVSKTSNKNGLEDITSVDIGYPATTNKDNLLKYMHSISNKEHCASMVTVFSTYQSISVISEAQKEGFYEFDLVICDEAHRTTGATEPNKDESAFTKIHNDNNITAKKRLYQTATPRIYGESAKKKADEKSVIIADMADEKIYGEEFYRIGFGDAIRKGILTDYKVMVLAVDEDSVFRGFQEMISKKESEIGFDDVTKIIGCWNGLVKRDGNSNQTLGQPMKRAIAFTGTIKESKRITEMFSTVVDEYLYNSSNYSNPFKIDIDHADGSMNAVQKNSKIDWLKNEVPNNTCRVLSNAKFLTEGIDVPDLDAIMFLKPRRSKIDIAQAVGRVMRKSEGKDYGYIILPIGVPAGSEAHSVLDNNEKYQVVWEILNALRSIDERFDATINKLELNKKKPEQIQVIGVGDAPNDLEEAGEREEQLAFELNEEQLSDLERAIYGKIVQKVGNVRYWEQWSKDVAEIARKHIERIYIILEDKNSLVYHKFLEFVNSLKHNINDSIDEEQAIEMLSQHLITKPIFDALFDTYSFIQNNPVSKSMEKMVSLLDEKGLMKEQEKLQEFYESVKDRASNIDNLEAKQKIIIQLYEKFFKTAFKETTDRLGIVFTPVEVVDFILKSVNDVSKLYFDKELSEKNVHMLDPFTGTGTFIVRLLQSGIIKKEDLVRKFNQELHANEIVLLSYYIATINIEEVFNSLIDGDYESFEGIVLTDTFESTETNDYFEENILNENNYRLQEQKKDNIFVIIGNPPYSIGQKNANDNTANLKYPNLNKRIENTYAKYSTAKLRKSLYDSYILALRWASDRIGEKGIVSFVINASFIDSNATSGVRKSIYEEFNYIYIYNLRGDARTSGEMRRKEAGNIFGEGSRTPVAIITLIKDGSNRHNIYYKDIGDYLNKTEKLDIISHQKSVETIDWKDIQPDNNHDWINQRDKNYESYFSITDIFNQKIIGVSTNRDSWVYGFNKRKTIEKSQEMISNYNDNINWVKENANGYTKDQRNMDSSKIKWTVNLTKKFKKGEKIVLNDDKIEVSMYRPFTKKWLYYDRNIIERPGKSKKLFNESNKAIYITGVGSSREFSALAVNIIPNLDLMEKGQGFVEFINDKNEEYENNINISSLNKFGLNKENLMYYIYGLFHSNDYKNKFSANLSKELPRIPLVKNKTKFIEIGRKLINLHLNYESCDLSSEVVINQSENPSYKIKKMTFPKRNEKSTIIVNNDITIKEIPNRAYDYKVNGKSAIEWVMDQYQIKVDKNSGIIDDPNEYSDDPKYILNHLLKIINLSVLTIDLIHELPPLEIIDK
ncbi:DEAD/DEAH box helicase [Staphylococcus equorum]|uniref:DEAD/DEAH box helicase n=3 Tax=Staphylococcus equorum TaxID=246432 RepID=UPI003D8045EF